MTPHNPPYPPRLVNDQHPDERAMRDAQADRGAAS